MVRYDAASELEVVHMDTFVEIMRNSVLVLAFLAALGAVMTFVARFFVGTSADRHD